MTLPICRQIIHGFLRQSINAAEKRPTVNGAFVVLRRSKNSCRTCPICFRGLLLALILKFAEPRVSSVDILHDRFTNHFVDGGDTIKNQFQTGFAEGCHPLAPGVISNVIDTGTGSDQIAYFIVDFE